MTQLGTLLLGVTLGFLLGCALSISHIKKIIRFHRTPSSTINTISPGKTVQVTGNVISEARDINSPLTQTPCVLWQAEVLQLVPAGDDVSWQSIFKESSMHPFDLQDDSGVLRIYPANAELMLRTDWYYESEIGSFPPEVDAVLKKLPYVQNPLRQSKRIRASERLVKAGERIHVIGRVNEQNDILTMSCLKDDFPILISDRSKSWLLIMLYLHLMVRVIVPMPLAAGIALLIASYI